MHTLGHLSPHLESEIKRRGGGDHPLPQSRSSWGRPPPLTMAFQEGVSNFYPRIFAEKGPNRAIFAASMAPQPKILTNLWIFEVSRLPIENPSSGSTPMILQGAWVTFASLYTSVKYTLTRSLFHKISSKMLFFNNFSKNGTFVAVSLLSCNKIPYYTKIYAFAPLFWPKSFWFYPSSIILSSFGSALMEKFWLASIKICEIGAIFKDWRKIFLNGAFGAVMIVLHKLTLWLIFWNITNFLKNSIIDI